MVEIKTAGDKEERDKLIYKAELMKKRRNSTFNTEFGMIASLGGVIITPMFLGILGGSYLDDTYPQQFSWRLIFLFLGIVWGCINAYFWIAAEEKKIAKLEDKNRKEDK